MPNFVRDVLATRAPSEPALVVLDENDVRTRWSFGEVIFAEAQVAALFVSQGVRRGDVVLTLVGNGIDYVLSMLACLHIGAVMLPCSEQLRAGDLALRLARTQPKLIVCATRNRDELDEALVRTGPPDCPVLMPSLLDRALADADAVVPEYAELGPAEAAFVLFTSGTSGQPKTVTHAQRYLWGQQLQAREWMAALPGELVWSTAAPGWSKSTRNTFLAPWLCGAAALLQDRRFDPAERLAVIRREGVAVLCMAPTEYRLIAAHGPIGALRSLRRIITAGEALGAPTVEAWREQTGLELADGYGQTETGHLAGARPGELPPPGSMGRPLPGIEIEIIDGELTVDPATVPTFFLGYGGEPAPSGRWHTGDRVRQDEDGWLYFEARVDDVIISAGYRIGPAEVESTLMGHPAVRECAVVGRPDPARGEIVVALVTLRDGFVASPELAQQLQTYVKAQTAPYKHPRAVQFVDELPKTASGKIHRAEVRRLAN
jgi:acyl-coenzyme A synthetase/AMP-(fatty) acid ligase